MSVKQWEYTIFDYETGVSDHDVIQTLNDLGAHGWELIGWDVTIIIKGTRRAFLKRAVR